MKKLKKKIIFGEELIPGGYIGFVNDENMKNFPFEITLINKTDDGIFQFGDEENKMFDYEELKCFIENDQLKPKAFKDRILEEMMKEIENY